MEGGTGRTPCLGHDVLQDMRWDFEMKWGSGLCMIHADPETNCERFTKVASLPQSSIQG